MNYVELLRSGSLSEDTDACASVADHESVENELAELVNQANEEDHSKTSHPVRCVGSGVQPFTVEGKLICF